MISCVLCAWGGVYNLQSTLDLLVLSLVEKGNAGQGDSQRLENVKQWIVKGTDTSEDINTLIVGGTASNVTALVKPFHNENEKCNIDIFTPLSDLTQDGHQKSPCSSFNEALTNSCCPIIIGAFKVNNKGIQLFHLRSVRLRLGSIRLRLICQFAYDSYVEALNLNYCSLKPKKKTQYILSSMSRKTMR